MVTTASFALGLAGCGGGSGGGSDTPPPPPPPPITKAEAFQLLNQATFGATEAEALEEPRVAMGLYLDVLAASGGDIP